MVITADAQFYVQGTWISSDVMLCASSNNFNLGGNDLITFEINFTTGVIRSLAGVQGNILTGVGLPFANEAIASFITPPSGGTIGGGQYVNADEFYYTSNVGALSTYNYGYYDGTGDRLDPSNWTFEVICTAGDYPYHEKISGDRAGRFQIIEPTSGGLPRAVVGRTYHGAGYPVNGLGTMEEWVRDPFTGWAYSRTLDSAPKTDYGNQGWRAVCYPTRVDRDAPGNLPLPIEAIWNDYVVYDSLWWSQANIKWEIPT